MWISSLRSHVSSQAVNQYSSLSPNSLAISHMFNVAPYTHKSSATNPHRTHTPSLQVSHNAQHPLNIHLVANQGPFFLTLPTISFSISPTILTAQNNKRNKFLFPNLRRNSFFNSILPQPSPRLILYPAFIIQKAQGLVKSHSPHAIRTSTSYC